MRAPAGQRWRSSLLALTLAFTIGCDQLSKGIAARRLAGGGAVEALGGSIRFQLAENRGAFLGMGDRLPEGARVGLLVVLVGVGLGAGAAFLFRDRRRRLARPSGWPSFWAAASGTSWTAWSEGP